MSPQNSFKSTQSLKRQRNKNKSTTTTKRTNYMRTALQNVKNGNTEDRKAKEQARAEKANK